MSVLQLFTNKDAVSLALHDAGVVRIPFTNLNNCISDLIEVYTKDILSFTEHYAIKQALQIAPACDTAIENTSLYIFRKKNFRMFLQMLSLEEVSTDSGESHTFDSSVLYCTEDTKPTLVGCPTFTVNDLEDFRNIESTEYAQRFSRDRLYIVQVNSNINCWDKFSSDITEYLLYIP